MAREYNLRERADIVSLAQECADSLKAQPLIDYFEALIGDDGSEDIRKMIFDDIKEYDEIDLEDAYAKHKTVKAMVDEMVESLLDCGGFRNQNIEYWYEYNESRVESLRAEVEACIGD